ncbi:MAG: FHA domain-containing protein [Planctomycetota bacterium]|nr:FHA domain-containing protein [Planctomycetota bacterium]
MPKLYVKEGWNKGAYYDIPEGKVTIGRSSSCKIRVKDFDVSRVHSEITMRDNGVVTIRDLQSKNGTLVNNSIVEEAQLKAGDETRVGNTVFVFMTDKETDIPSEGIDLEPMPDEPDAPMQTIIGIQQSSLFAEKEGAKEEGTQALQRAKTNLKLLNQIHQGIASEMELSRVLEKIMDLVFEKMTPDQGFILLLDEKSGKLVPRFSRNKKGQTSFSDIGVSRSIINRALKDEVAILSQDIFGGGQQSQSIVQFNIKSAMCVPLKAKEHILGVLQVHNRLTSPDFSDDDLELLTAICNMTAMAIENAKLYQDVQKEVKRRSDLSKYFSPQLVEQLMEGNLDMNMKGQKEKLTILFSDIRGFTRLSGDLAPEMLVDMLNDHLSMLTNVLFKHQGFLSKFLGDGLMAVFSVPRAHPDDGQKAVRAALEMQERNKQLNDKWAKEGKKIFPVGIGINTGIAMIGNVGGEQLEFAILGDVVNVAARLCSKAKADEVLISRSTKDELPDTFEVEGPQHLELKGKVETTEAYSVLRELQSFSI